MDYRVFEGAYERNTGGYRAHILHEIIHPFADKMGVPVKAPTDTLWILPSGKMVIGKSPFSNTGKWKTYYPGGKKK